MGALPLRVHKDVAASMKIVDAEGNFKISPWTIKHIRRKVKEKYDLDHRMYLQIGKPQGRHALGCW
jgi:hypothetical protein